MFNKHHVNVSSENFTITLQSVYIELISELAANIIPLKEVRCVFSNSTVTGAVKESSLHSDQSEAIVFVSRTKKKGKTKII